MDEAEINKQSSLEFERAKKIIVETIRFLNLDLTGISVLTEVGTGLFNYTPIIAQFANASKIYALAKDNTYGNSFDAINACKEKLKYFKLKSENIYFAENTLPEEFLSNSQIITNSGNLRPLDASKLKLVTKGAAIPLMYEAWELRNDDLDIRYCKENNISVAGTWENYPGLEIFNYCKNLIIKIAFEAGFEIKSNKIIVWSDDHFGKLAYEGFTQLGAREVTLVSNPNDLYNKIENADFIFFCNYKSTDILLAEKASILDLKYLKKLNPSVSIVHLAGDIDNTYVKNNGIKIYPDKRGYSIRMTYTLSHLGIKPALMLLVAGLKVGEVLIKNENSKISQIV